MKILAENGMLGQDRNLVSVDFGSLLVILHYSIWIWFHFTRIMATVLSLLPYFKRIYEFLFISHLLLLPILFIIFSAILFNIGLWHLLLFVISNTPIPSMLSVEFFFWSGLNWFGSRLHFLCCPDLRLYQSHCFHYFPTELYHFPTFATQVLLWYYAFWNMLMLII